MVGNVFPRPRAGSVPILPSGGVTVTAINGVTITAISGPVAQVRLTPSPVTPPVARARVIPSPVTPPAAPVPETGPQLVPERWNPSFYPVTPFQDGGVGIMYKLDYAKNGQAGVVDRAMWANGIMWDSIVGRPPLLIGPQGPPGPAGPIGAPGIAATVTAGTTTTSQPGTSADVINAGNSSAAVFDFTIPRGDVGATGPIGAQGPTGATGAAAHTLSAVDFTVPPVGSTVDVTVLDASWVVHGEVLWIDTAGGPGAGGTLVVTAKSGNTLTLLNSAGQAAITYPYDISLYWAGILAANTKLTRFVFDRAISFAVNLAGSIANAGTAATASVSITIAKNGTSIGSLTFAAGATSGAFSVAAATNFAIGDLLTLVGPGAADATLADISVTLTGTRT
jgi:hypothetical protein